MLITPEEAKFERSFIGNFGFYSFYKAELFGLVVNDQIVSVNATRFSSRPRKEAWGRYINFFMAYTPHDQRRNGYATELQLFIQSYAVQNNYQRVKSLIQSWGGVRLHLNCGHDYYGLSKGGEIVVDAPIVNEQFPEGIPKQARPSVNGEPKKLTKSDLFDIVTNEEGLFKIPPVVAETVLSKYTEDLRR
jgi:hypothetical protein